jgi:hypothetical protein
MGSVLEDQGYDTIEDCRAMGGATLSAWGTEDRALFERLVRFIDEKPGQHFLRSAGLTRPTIPTKSDPPRRKSTFSANTSQLSTPRTWVDT